MAVGVVAEAPGPGNDSPETQFVWRFKIDILWEGPRFYRQIVTSPSELIYPRLGNFDKERVVRHLHQKNIPPFGFW